MDSKQEFQKSSSWMVEVDSKLSDFVKLGVRSSRKPETRMHRERFYMERMMMLKMQMSAYQHLLELERALRFEEQQNEVCLVL